jgi:predicted ATPase
VIRHACAAEGGVEVDTQGDAFFFAFPTASGALAAASTFTEALALGAIQVRVGMHTGAPLLAEEGYIGDDVHFAARVAAAGHGGQVILSAATADLVDDVVTHLGEHRLKDIPLPVSIFQVGDGSFPPLKTIANTNLPTPISSFVGREEELYEAEQLLQRARLLTVTGPGGAGKTRFAIELVRRAREERFSDYPGGVFGCFLASLRDAGLVLPTIAKTLSVAEEPGRAPLDALASQLEGKRMLLLLDNLEHLLPATLELSQLLERCSGLALVVTSRELLRVDGESSYALPALADEESVALLCERSAVEPSRPIRDLAVRLDGLPLAIELAAVRLSILTPEQLLERLSQRLDLLKGRRDGDPRQQTLRATIEWSYDLLIPEEQQLFARLAVFAGGCTLDAAEDVVEADLDTLQSLADKNLLRFTDGRYWMLETIREFADQCLDETSERPRLSSRHAGYFRELADSLAPRLREPEPIRLVENDIENFRSAVAWAQEHDPELVAHLIAALAYFWGPQGHATEVFGWLDRLREESLAPDVRMGVLRTETGIANTTFDVPRIRAASQQRLDLARQVGDLGHEAAALYMLGVACQYDQDFEGAQQHYEAALALGFNDPGWRPVIFAALGMLAQERGDLATAQRFLEEQRTAAGNDYEVAWGLIALGGVAADMGNHEEARQHLAQGSEMAVQLRNPELTHMALLTVAFLLARRGEPRDAAALAGSAAALGEALGMKTVSLHRLSATLDRLPDALGEPDFERLFGKGRALGTDEALRFARSCLN